MDVRLGFLFRFRGGYYPELSMGAYPQEKGEFRVLPTLFVGGMNTLDQKAEEGLRWGGRAENCRAERHGLR